MSGRSKKNQINDLEGSHPQELNLQHRHFLVRSLGRNDTDLAALLRVNASLAKLKEQLLEACGELVLLDLGSGRLSLLQDELHYHPHHGVEYTLSPTQTQLCVDFLLRMKLRRKLANRLIRRLNRVAQAMDGVDVSPPPPPRYGDLRLHVSPDALQHFTKHQEFLKKAREFVESFKEGSTAEGTVKEEEREETATSEPALVKSGGDETRAIKVDEAAAEEKNGSSEDPKPEGAQSADAPKEEQGETNKNGEANPEVAAAKPATTPAESIPGDNAKPLSAPSAPTEVVGASQVKPIAFKSLQEAYEVLREYEDAYSKVWDEDSQSWTYVLTKQDSLPDYRAITAGAAIGATTRLLSMQEREQEFRRWQTSILARIPNQPTFEQLGMKNRVFMLEQRRKRCLEDIEGDAGTKEARDTKKHTVESDHEDDYETKMDDVASQDGDATQNNEKPKKIQLAPRKKKETDENEDRPEQEQAQSEGPRLIKPMCLAAVPSFYDQDLNRVRAVHGDLMGFSLMEQTRQSIAEATNQYNAGTFKYATLIWGCNIFLTLFLHVAAHRRSNQLYDHRTRLQQNMSFFLQKSRSDLVKVNNEHGLMVAMAKQQWMKQKIEHDQKRVKQFLPSTWGHLPFGTNATQQYQQRGGIQAMVAASLADIVDGVILLSEGKVANTKFASFQAPAAPANHQTGESLQQQISRSENEFRLQLEQTNVQYQQSEEARQRAWTKMMKAKAEIESLTGGAGRQGYLDLSNYHRVALPPLRNSQLQQMPQDLASRANVASFTPPPVPGTNSFSMSKYSAAKVRERMSNDGSVAPVAEPKKDKDGLFVRPAGRTRKGMKWDAVQGIWVPATRK